LAKKRASGSWTAPEGRGAFAGFIGPRNLLELVRGTAPWLFDARHPRAAELPPARDARLVELGAGPLGWWAILAAAEQLEPSAQPGPAEVADYFALCLAAHFATVATYVPTDVDAKIRRALWLDQPDASELARMARLAHETAAWDLAPVSARLVAVEGLGLFSGHDGERLSVLCGGWIGASARAQAELARSFEQAVADELAREARAFEAVVARVHAGLAGAELDLLRLAAVLTHNAGDVMQSLGSAEARCIDPGRRAIFTDLARERFERFGGAYGRAAALYRACMSSEGHRNYPLRALKPLRAAPELLLPIAPFLDAWGERLATWPAWGPDERAEIVSGLVVGCRKVAGQQGYQRALSGFARAHPGGLEAPELAQRYGTAVRRELKDGALRREIERPRGSFEASCAKLARSALGPAAPLR
jgi:hypothetical protein